MKLRDEIIQDMYDMVNNDGICEDVRTGFDGLSKYIESILPGGETDECLDEGMNLICCLEYASFFAGANMVLDFISGREV